MEEIGKYIWIQNKQDQYDTIPEITDEAYKVEVDSDHIKETISIDKAQEYLEVCPSCLKGVNNLQHLEDYSINNITHNLRIRFFENKFYTFIDKNILLSLNPFDSSEYIDKEYLQIYRNFFNKNNPNPEPHLFYIAESAYQNLLKDNCNQSIIFSGESGGGKTQLTKAILKYFSFMNTKKLNSESIDNAMQLLESFGNAKTIHHKNSSRFLKFIKIYFNDEGSEVISYEFSNALLETSRLVKLQPDEFNFNIFYQIIDQLGEDDKKKYFLNNDTISFDSFYYLSHNSCGYTKCESENNLSRTKNLFNFFNFTEKDIETIFSLIIGILFIGNIEYEEVFINGCTYADLNLDDENLSNAASLLEIEKKDLKAFLTRNKNDKNLQMDSAMIKRDSLSKNIYLFIFNWITNKINIYFAQNSDRNSNQKFIGILDMFGHESYEISNYDQFCANYANEKIQNFFNVSVFREQEFYLKEKINCDRIDYLDNNGIIELIEKDSTGILSILNSQANLTTTEFKNLLYTNISENSNYLGDSVDGFILINHTTGEVIYDVNNFLENSKNVSLACEEFLPLSQIIKNSGENLNMSHDKKFILNELVRTLANSKPFFIKCIRPNPVGTSNTFYFFRVGEQILSSGVIDTLKLKNAGYTSIYTLEKFYKKYRSLVPEQNLARYLGLSSEEIIPYDDVIKDMLDFILDSSDIKLLKKNSGSLITPPIQLGESKIFMREEIKIALREKLNYVKKVSFIQSYWKGYNIRNNFQKIGVKAIIIQSSYRHYKFKEFIKNKIKSLIKMSKDVNFEGDNELNYSKMIIKNDYNNSFNLNLSIDENLDISLHSGASLSELTDGVSNVKNYTNPAVENSNMYNKSPDVANINSNNDKFNKTPTKLKSAEIFKNIKKFGNSKNSINSEDIVAASKSRISEKIRTSKLKISEIKNNSLQKLQTDQLLNINILTTEEESNHPARNILSQFEENLSQENPDKNLNQIQIQKNNFLEISNNQFQYQTSNFNQNENENLNNSLIENLNNIFYLAKEKKSSIMKPKQNLSLKDLYLNNMIGSEYISTIEKLKEEIIFLQKEKENLNIQLTTFKSSKDKDIELLNEKLKQLKNVIVNCEQEIKELNEKNSNSDNEIFHKPNSQIESEIEKLREENIKLIKSLLDRESQLEILNMSQTNLKKTNEELNKIIESNKEQSAKKKEKEENEINSLLELIHNLQKEKIENEAKFITLDNKFQYCSNLSLNSKFENSDFFLHANEKNPNEIIASYKKIMSNLKNVNRNLNLQIEKIRFDTQIEIIKLSSENREKIENLEKMSKDFFKLELEANSSRKENLDFQNSNRQLKDIAEKLQSRLNILEKKSKISKNFTQLEESLRNKEIEIRELKSQNEYDLQNLERVKKMEIALKEELIFKENDIEKRREIIKAIQDQLENSNEVNLKLKKENIQIKSKLELKEIEIHNKYENNLKLKNEENSLLMKKLVIYEKYLPEFKNEIEKKRIRISKNKKMNAILIELLKIKRNQMQCMEALQYTNSLNIKDNLKKFENDEINLMKEVQDISSSLEDSEDEEEEELYEEEIEKEGRKKTK